MVLVDTSLWIQHFRKTEQHSLMGKGIGLIDVHLLASCALSHGTFWTRDSRLRQAGGTVVQMVDGEN